MKAAIVKLSLCECGFPVLSDCVKLGAEYEVEPTMQDDFQLICGGCGKNNPVRGIFVHGKGNRHGGFLPKDIFDLSTEEKAHAE